MTEKNSSSFATDATDLFIVDNNRVRMKDTLDALLDSKSLDVAVAFVDAYGVAQLNAMPPDSKCRLLVGYDLSDMPQNNDVVTFQMAEEWRKSGLDPVHRVNDDETVFNAIAALERESLQAKRTALQTHSKLYVNERIGVVGSSNLTRSGIMGQRELNLIHQHPNAIAQLREWFQSNWDEASRAERSDFKNELVEWLRTNRLRRFAPFHPYAKAIFERYRSRFISLASSPSDINLAVFQEEGRETALGILAEHKCCIIADAVGLGKTYIALGAMQKRARNRKRSHKRVLVICPAQLESVWRRAANNQGIMIETESMETLGNQNGSGSERRLSELEDFALVIVDEAHNFRNPATNRFNSLMRILQGGPDDKETLFLTATPINNGIGDLYSLYRLMTRDQDDFFLNTNLRIRSLQEFFKRVEKGFVSTTDLLLETMVCRSRLDIRRRQENGETIIINDREVRFPNRKMISLEYRLGSDDETVDIDHIAKAIENLTLGAYNIEQYALVPDLQRNQTFMRLQTLFKMLLLKRLESSVISFVSTAENLRDFSRKVVEMLQKGRRLTADEYRRMQMTFARQLEDDDEGEGSAYLRDIGEKDASQYDIERLSNDVETDLRILSPLVNRIKRCLGGNDGKLRRLKVELCKLLPDQKALIFTSYSDTAEYLYRELTEDDEFLKRVSHARIEMIVGGVTSSEKNAIVQDFAPIANERKGPPERPIQCLISTDVLSEGQNLQDCGFLINYDLHFNPVRMIQRNGRIDRLFSEHESITIANFFPEGGLEEQLGLIERLQQRIATIQENMPVDASVIGEKVRVFSLEELRRTRSGDVTVLDAIDAENPINRFHDMLNEVIKMLQEFGIEEINRIPWGCQSNKRATYRGVFLCVAAGKTDDPIACWWLYYPLDSNDKDKSLPEPIQEPSRIIDLIRSSRPEREDDHHPDFSPRAIRWDIALEAKKRCREMLRELERSRDLGQVWSRTHINHKLISFFSAHGDGLEVNIEARLRRHSLERDKAEGERLLREATRSGNTSDLIAWMDEKLPQFQRRTENAETVPLTVAAYLELTPEAA